MFQGIFTAIVTPFRDGAVDERAFAALIERQIAGGAQGLVVMGSTGEAATLEEGERRTLLRWAARCVAKRLPLIAGTGSNSTRQAIRWTQQAAEDGADGALVVTPYYNKPTQEGLLAHFRAVAREASIPLVVYNVPGRTGVNLLPETACRLGEIEGIAAIKESSGNLTQIEEILRGLPPHLSLLAGDDPIFLPVLALGGRGIVSVASNLVPRSMRRLYDLYQGGRHEEARQLFHRLYPLTQAIFLESNPIPVKRALAHWGLIADELRLPLLPMSEKNAALLLKVLQPFEAEEGGRHG